MDLLSRIASWLGENEATISAVVGITVLAGILFAGLRWLLLRSTTGTPEKLLVRPGRRTAVIAASGAVLLALAGILAWLVWPDEPFRGVASPVGPDAFLPKDSSPGDLNSLTVPGFGGRPAIAVLPFENLSRDTDQEYFADGIAEDLITRLSAWREFPVIARNSSFTYKGHPVDVKQVSRELGVRYVVEGSVRKAGDRVRISAQLIDATTGAHVWAEHYDRRMEHVFAIQDEITTAIAGAMGAKLAVTEEERAAQQPTQNLTAYDLLMRGRWYYNRGWIEGNLEFIRGEARSLFERAIEIDPRFAAAFAWLAQTYDADWYSPTEYPAQALEEMEQAARRSVSLDPELPVGHLVLGLVHQIRGELNEALAAARHANKLDPSFADSYRHMGFYLAEAGEPDEAIAVLEKGIRLSPRDPAEFLRAKSHAHFAAERYLEAVECAKQSIAQGAPTGLAWLVLAAGQAHLGQDEEAAAALWEAEALLGWTPSATELRRAGSISSRVSERANGSRIGHLFP